MGIQIAILVIIIVLTVILYFLGQKLSDDLRSIGMFICFLAACGVGYWMYSTFVTKARIRVENEKCLERIQELTAAVDKFNEKNDKGHLMQKLEIQKLKDSNLNLLKTEFIQPDDKKEFECTYVSSGDLSGGGEIECTIHGKASKIKIEIEKSKN